MVECGYCHKLIRSDPLGKRLEEGVSYTIYECEHCRVHVETVNPAAGLKI